MADDDEGWKEIAENKKQQRNREREAKGKVHSGGYLRLISCPVNIDPYTVKPRKVQTIVHQHT
jgi:hypothetical protein